MGTTSEKLTYLNTTKTKIKDSINLMGANITNETFRSYADKIQDQLELFLADNSVDRIWNNWEKVNATNVETTSLSPTIKGKMKIDLKGNTQQNGTPTPDTPIPVQVVSGDNSIKVEGKNLLNTQSFELGYINGSGVYTSDNLNALFDYCEVEQNENYTISFNGTVYGFRYIYYNASKTFISRSDLYTTNQTITIPSNVKYLRVYFNKNNQPMTQEEINELNIKIIKTNEIQTYPISLGNIELCKIGTYQDSIVKDNGKWYLNKQIGKVVLNGTQNITLSNWRATASSVGWLYPYSIINSITSGSTGTTPQIICNKLIPANVNDLYNGAVDNGIGLWQDTSYGIVVRTSDTSLTSVPLINTYLSNNPMSVYVPLATPTYEEITDTTLLSQLEALAYSYEGTTNISQVNDDMPFILDITALKEI